MAIKPKETADETRERISVVAEGLFRRLGFAKTAVADIAAELGMSAANVYRFFPSKTAIVETICNRCLAEVEREAEVIARASGPARQRIMEMIVAVMRYHRDNFLVERRVHDMVLVAMEHNWGAIEAHKMQLCNAIQRMLEQGITEGAFLPHDTGQVAQIVMGACVRFCHPVLIAQCIDEDLEAEAMVATGFLLRAIEVERLPL
ncbi:TetR family transcriptional regulator [Azorhizobium sp. AG788]|uniref:TetR/AcrR family transcriptional regulator n=1 Tax=Azorhizobium sp. AG788 TaxID=2183897 RepID=UPI0031388F12